MVKNGSQAFRGLRRVFRMEASMRSYPVAICSHVYLLSSKRVAELHTFEGFLSMGEL